MDFGCEPAVELAFAEGSGENCEIYTVRRVPRHLKTITRGAGKGKQREITGSVSLIMPDGMEYPSKETDRKLQEIDRKSTRLNSSHCLLSRMPSSA